MITVHNWRQLFATQINTLFSLFSRFYNAHRLWFENSIAFIHLQVLIYLAIAAPGAHRSGNSAANHHPAMTLLCKVEF